MAKVDLPPDFKDLFESLNSAGVEYLVVGGYAVIHYGYARSTGDLDVWVAVNPANAEKITKVLREAFDFSPAEVKPELFLEVGRLISFGVEPMRIDILTAPSGVDFATSYPRRTIVVWDGVKVPLIGFEDLKLNKTASGRAKDLADLENLPPALSVKRPRRKRR